MNARILLAMMLLVGVAAAAPICVSRTVPLSALANSTCRVGTFILKFGSLEDHSYRPGFQPIDPNSYHIQISVSGNSITFHLAGIQRLITTGS